MKIHSSITIGLLIFLTGCSAGNGGNIQRNEKNPQRQEAPAQIESQQSLPKAEGEVVVPIAGYAERRTLKAFGEFIQDRFNGYHVGDDIEYKDVTTEVPVSAIAEGLIRYFGEVKGYGGVMIVEHSLKNHTVKAIYGHLDLASSTLKNGDKVTKGQFLANLGDHESKETDGERKHLHFALYEDLNIRLNGYESSPQNVSSWINPQDFFEENGLQIKNTGRLYTAQTDLGGDIFHLALSIPEGWEVEYIPSLQALNLFTLEGPGTARERSQILIRYFDASNFLTLQTVNIYETADLKIGTENYTAKKYDIEKKPDIEEFLDQPSWRNKRHIVTDFREKDGFTRYYVVAANPDLQKNIYESVLASIKILP